MHTKTADILEITLNNPINVSEINKLIEQIKIGKKNSFLIINSGNHDFTSIEVIRLFKVQMQKIEMQLLKFKKIALIHPPEYKNISNNPELYQYFTSISDAKKWFLE